jgi:phospholipase/carboxylesterase
MAFKLFAPFTKLQTIFILSVYALLVLYGTGVLQTVILVKEPLIYEKPPLSGQPPKKLIFFLHGANNNVGGIADVAEEMAPYFKDALLIIPEAREPSRVIPYSLSWYNRGVREVTELGAMVENATPFLVALIEEKALEHKIDYKNIAIVGYSQGAAVALNVIHKLKEPIGGLVSLSGYIGTTDAEYKSEFKHKVPTQLLHGRKDFVIPLEEMHRIKAQFNAQNAPVSAYIIDDLDHDISIESIARSIAFLTLEWR